MPGIRWLAVGCGSWLFSRALRAHATEQRTERERTVAVRPPSFRFDASCVIPGWSLSVFQEHCTTNQNKKKNDTKECMIHDVFLTVSHVDVGLHCVARRGEFLSVRRLAVC